MKYDKLKDTLSSLEHVGAARFYGEDLISFREEIKLLLKDYLALKDAINEAWKASYPDCEEVEGTKAIVFRVKSLEADRKCWLANAKANQRECNRLGAELAVARENTTPPPSVEEFKKELVRDLVKWQEAKRDTYFIDTLLGDAYSGLPEIFAKHGLVANLINKEVSDESPN